MLSIVHTVQSRLRKRRAYWHERLLRLVGARPERRAALCATPDHGWSGEDGRRISINERFGANIPASVTPKGPPTGLR